MENAKVPCKMKNMIKRLSFPSCHERLRSSDRYSRSPNIPVNKILLLNAKTMCQAPDSIASM